MREYPPFFVGQNQPKGGNLDTISLETVKAANHRAGRYWFTPDTTRFFRSRYSEYAYKVGDRAYFITSEQFDDHSPRLFTLRVCDLTTGEVDTVGEFQQYRSRHLAEKAMRELAKNR